MKALAYSNNRPREIRIFRSLAQGAKQHGDVLEIRDKSDYGKFRKFDGPDPSADLTIAYGVKSRDMLKEHYDAGCPWAIIDKGYVRRSGPHGVERWSRISVNQTYPTQMQERNALRWQALAARAKLVLAPLREVRPGMHTAKSGDSVLHGHVLVAGSSQKFYSYFGIGDEAQFHGKLIRRLRKVLRDAGTRREIVFRPKPSYEKRHRKRAALHAYGAHRLSLPDESISDALRGAWCLVTFASNAACDAIFDGVPAVVLGPHASSAVADGALADAPTARFPTQSERLRWARSLAWEMWTLEEMINGEAWAEIRRGLEERPMPEGEWFSWKHWGDDAEEDDGS